MGAQGQNGKRLSWLWADQMHVVVHQHRISVNGRPLLAGFAIRSLPPLNSTVVAADAAKQVLLR